MAAKARVQKRLYYKIGEACKALGIQPYVLRYWETEFSALSPSKSRSGQRVYSEKELEVIRRIKQLLYDECYTIAGAKKKLEGELAAGTLGEPTAAAAAAPAPGGATASFQPPAPRVQAPIAGRGPGGAVPSPALAAPVAGRPSAATPLPPAVPSAPPAAVAMPAAPGTTAAGANARPQPAPAPAAVSSIPRPAAAPAVVQAPTVQPAQTLPAAAGLAPPDRAGRDDAIAREAASRLSPAAAVRLAQADLLPLAAAEVPLRPASGPPSPPQLPLQAVPKEAAPLAAVAASPSAPEWPSEGPGAQSRHPDQDLTPPPALQPGAASPAAAAAAAPRRTAAVQPSAPLPGPAPASIPPLDSGGAKRIESLRKGIQEALHEAREILARLE